GVERRRADDGAADEGTQPTGGRAPRPGGSPARGGCPAAGHGGSGVRAGREGAVKIVSAEARSEELGLTRPYTIAFRSIDSVSNAIVEIRSDSGHLGLGAASPEPKVTGETFEICLGRLAADALDWLIGRDVSEVALLCAEAKIRMPDAPAARAAVDMALHDLFAQQLGRPLVDVLGRAHRELPTSITIGIQGIEETLADAH